MSAYIVALGISVGLTGEAYRTDSLGQLLERTSRHVGTTWCGTIHGQLHIGPRIFSVFGYQVVLPGSEELVIQIIPTSLGRSETGEQTRLLRISHQGELWRLQETGRDPRPIVPSPELRRALRWGMAYGLPKLSEASLEIGPADTPGMVQVQTTGPVIFLSGVEGKMRFVLDRDTGRPLKFNAFGLREWQGREIDDYKLGMTFDVVPGCRLANVPPKRGD